MGGSVHSSVTAPRSTAPKLLAMMLLRSSLYELFRDLSVVMLPFVAIQIAPFDVPGILMPSPVSAVTLALNFSAVGSLVGAPPSVYPGHFLALVAPRTGAAMVVVLPLSHVIVPPPANAASMIGMDFPPVFPPVHPLTTIVDELVLVIVLHTIFVAAHAGGATTKVAPAMGITRVAVNSNARRILPPSRLIFWE